MMNDRQVIILAWLGVFFGVSALVTSMEISSSASDFSSVKRGISTQPAYESRSSQYMISSSYCKATWVLLIISAVERLLRPSWT
jgi:hypothetical protein